MNVFDVLRTLDPALNQKPVNFEISDLNIVFDSAPSARVTVMRPRWQRAFVPALVAACISFITVASLVVPKDSSLAMVFLSVPNQMSAEYAEKQASMAATEPLGQPDQILRLTFKRFNDSSQDSNVDYLGSLTSSFVNLNRENLEFTPMWESTIPFSSKGAMLFALQRHSLSKILTPENPQLWMKRAVHALIVSRTAAPAQRLTALAINQSSWSYVLNDAPWYRTNIGGQKVWMQEINTIYRIERYVVDPQTPGIRSMSLYRKSNFSDPILIYDSQVGSWAFVTSAGGDVITQSGSDFELLDLSKL